MSRPGILGAIGSTPIFRLERMVPSGSASVFGKAEFLNPGGSVKDRIALAMIEDAEDRGLLKPGSTVIEPSSGNTGIGLALVCAVKGFKCVITMPESMSLERVYMLEYYGAQVVLTKASEGMPGAIQKASELAAKTPGAFVPHQFENKANVEIHRRTTAEELLRQAPDPVDAFVAGVGTGGTISAVGAVLKKKYPNVKIIAVEPSKSPVLSGGKAAAHRIQGIGAGFVPPILDRSVIDEIVKVDDDHAYKTAKELASKEGLLCGISSGANVYVSLEIAKRLGAGRNVVTILCDRGERYFSTTQYFEF